jgi:hypothetical protein
MGERKRMYPQIPHTLNPYRQDTKTYKHPHIIQYTDHIDKNCIQTVRQTVSHRQPEVRVTDVYGHIHPHTHGSADRETKLTVSHIDRGARVKIHTNSFLGLEVGCVR